ncbi:putative uncharacterized protein DDB_G0282499 [Condylostylus longicornis]|uniref:putative uncharacterized protein DDB_G0282499 n=1 Tax=Condylostylus longicornis TaxID=2530218 RepID=UPI00244E31BA|nr:putative uncharacterized protein DDB_G0282499 [Condylostylus longicornis]
MISIMEVEQLIKAICARPPLWDRTSKEYHNRVLTEKCWDEICDEVNEPKDKIKRKWKGLRDTYRFELRKFLSLNSEHSVDNNSKAQFEYEPSWPFFKTLNFLKDHVNIRSDLNKVGKKSAITLSKNSQSNFHSFNDDWNSLQNFNQTEIFDSSNNDLDSNISNNTMQFTRELAENDIYNEIDGDIKPVIVNSHEEDDHSNIGTNIQTNVNNKVKDISNHKNKDSNDNYHNYKNSNEKKLGNKKRKWYEIGEKIIDLEYEKINFLKEQKYNEHSKNIHERTIIRECDNDDEDKCFFNSLLPHIKKLQPAKKLKCRMDIQKLIYDYCYQNVE